MQPFICGICLEELGSPPLGENGQVIGNNQVMGTTCGHVFHDFCFQRWSKDKEIVDCPQCRDSLLANHTKNILFLSRSNVETKHPIAKNQLKNMSKKKLCEVALDLSKQLYAAKKETGVAEEKAEQSDRSKQILETNLREKQVEVIQLTAALQLATRPVANATAPARRTATARMSTGGRHLGTAFGQPPRSSSRRLAVAGSSTVQPQFVATRMRAVNDRPSSRVSTTVIRRSAASPYNLRDRTRTRAPARLRN